MAVENIASSSKAFAPVPMHVSVIGRVEDVNLFDGTFITGVLTPAADSYSKPQYVEVRSDKRFAQKGEEISLMLKLGGYPSKFEARDKKTGEIRTVTKWVPSLELVE